jgi:hypothetical protein
LKVEPLGIGAGRLGLVVHGDLLPATNHHRVFGCPFPVLGFSESCILIGRAGNDSLANDQNNNGGHRHHLESPLSFGFNRSSERVDLDARRRVQPSDKANPQDDEDHNPTHGVEVGPISIVPLKGEPIIIPHIAYPRAMMFEQTTGESDCLPA